MPYVYLWELEIPFEQYSILSGLVRDLCLAIGKF